MGAIKQHFDCLALFVKGLTESRSAEVLPDGANLSTCFEPADIILVVLLRLAPVVAIIVIIKIIITDSHNTP